MKNMERRALIIYCDDTKSDPLDGPEMDYLNYREFLESKLGGNWNSREIDALQNPTSEEVQECIDNFLNDADYSFIIFTGHGCIGEHDKMQYLELADKDIKLEELITTADRQTIIVDACRGLFNYNIPLLFEKAEVDEAFSNYGGSPHRALFDKAVLNCEEGITILYAASENESALDTNQGGAYLVSLLAAANEWKQENSEDNVFTIQDAHIDGTIYLKSSFDTLQKPELQNHEPQKRNRYFPFAVKDVVLFG